MSRMAEGNLASSSQLSAILRNSYRYQYRPNGRGGTSSTQLDFLVGDSERRKSARAIDGKFDSSFARIQLAYWRTCHNTAAQQIASRWPARTRVIISYYFEDLGAGAEACRAPEPEDADGRENWLCRGHLKLRWTDFGDRSKRRWRQLITPKRLARTWAADQWA